MESARHYDHADYDRIYATPLADNQIRLLRFLPPDQKVESVDEVVSPPTEKLRCALERITLGETNFFAVSYVWGDRSNLETIEVNGAPFHTTQNAHKLLSLMFKSITNTEKTTHYNLENTRVWIDAICIDQQNLREKEAQVELMRDIYNKAEHTLVVLNYLGDSETRCYKAIEWVKQLVDSTSPGTFITNKQHRESQWEEDKFECLCEMMRHPWFQRRWVIQEAALSRSLFVCYGPVDAIPWPTFAGGAVYAAQMWADQHTGVKGDWLSSGGLPFSMNTVVLASRNLSSQMLSFAIPRLVDLLSTVPMCHTSEPLDRIFALLGLCSEAERIGNRPDYNLSLVDAFRRFICTHIRTYNNLDVLCLASEHARSPGYRTDKDSVAGWMDSPPAILLPSLPTWVPNLTCPLGLWELGSALSQSHINPRPCFNASLNVPANVPNLDSLEYSEILIVQGIEVDIIHAVDSRTPIPSDEVYDIFDPQSPIFEELSEFSQLNPQVKSMYKTEKDFLTAFCRTISGGGVFLEAPTVFTDAYLRYYFHERFMGSRFGDILNSAGFDQLKPADRKDWVADPELVLLWTTDDPPIRQDRLIAFTFATTATGRLGLVPRTTKAGDSICIVYGCSSPLILHKSSIEDCFTVRGEAYIHGIMFGEAIEAEREGRLKSSILHLK